MPAHTLKGERERERETEKGERERVCVCVHVLQAPSLAQDSWFQHCVIRAGISMFAVLAMLLRSQIPMVGGPATRVALACPTFARLLHQ